MTINPRFIEYFRDTFFQNKEVEFQEFIASLEKGIPRTIRIRPGKEDEVRKRLLEYGFVLEGTHIKNVFALARAENFNPLERRIGFTVDHLVGNFYIQELAAATSVHVLSNGVIHEDPYLILDMAASPGGKTTQLAEQYPSSFIIANEPTRERIPQLLQNLDRMGSSHIGVTLYPGQYFAKTPEVFDRILLDAPCSGEGTLYKGTDATKHWHIKNIKSIARLQEKLIDAAFQSLKLGGEMVYSTCSMNLFENEGVLQSLEKKYPSAFEVLFQKRFWPHTDKTGGFFVAKIRKTQSVSQKVATTANTNDEIRKYRGPFPYELSSGYSLYEHREKILAVKNHTKINTLLGMYYFMRFGEMIGRYDGSTFSSMGHTERYIETTQINRYVLSSEEELDMYLRGGSLPYNGEEGEILIQYGGVDICLERIKSGYISNTFPSDWRRK